MKKKETVLLSFLHSDTNACVTSESHFLPPMGVDQPVAGWGFKPFGWDEMRHAGRGGGCAPNDKRRSPQTVENNFKAANERRERWQTGSCNVSEQRGAEAVWGCTFLGCETNLNSLKFCQGGTCAHQVHSRACRLTFLKPAGLCLWWIIQKSEAGRWCVDLCFDWF